MAVLYITSDRPGAGKTALASALAARLSLAGKRVGYFKPFSLTPQEDADVQFIGREVLTEPDNLAQPVSTGNQALQETTARELKQSLERVAASNELVLVEGPSLSAFKDGYRQISASLADLIEARVLLIMRYRPSLTVVEVLGACETFGQRLMGVLVNQVTLYREREVRLNMAPAIESHGVKFLGAIPEDRLMLSVTVGQMAQHLGARWVLGQDKAQELVENFLIGGNVMDSGINYFSRMDSKAVIVRGDRPDIQLAALSVPTTCLFLTGGHEPIQYVYHEAERQEVPLLVVDTDTVSTASALNTVLDGSTSHHPRKLERFQELLSRSADITAMESGA